MFIFNIIKITCIYICYQKLCYQDLRIYPKLKTHAKLNARIRDIFMLDNSFFLSIIKELKTAPQI